MKRNNKKVSISSSSLFANQGIKTTVSVAVHYNSDDGTNEIISYL
jgi:hypothetical protein